MHRAACCVALLVACDQAQSLRDAGLDGALDEQHVAQCKVPEADAGPPTYRWSFDQQTTLENNGLIPPVSLGLDPKSFFEFDNGTADDDTGCGVYLVGDLALGDLGVYPPAPRRWRISAWFRGSSDGVLFDFEGIQLTLRSEELAIAQTGTTSTFTTLLSAGDARWHAVALQVDATVTPLSIQVLLDKNAPYQSPSSLTWTLGSSTTLVIGVTVDPKATNDFDEVSFFRYE